MTQSELADKAGITWRNRFDIDYSKRTVSVDVIGRIVEVFILMPSSLISQVEKSQMQ